MDYPNGTPKKLTKNNYTEAQPIWNSNGKTIYFATWSENGGSIRSIDIASGKETILTKENALYQGLAINEVKNRIVFNRTNVQKFKDSKDPTYNDDEDELCWLDLNDGSIHVIDKANGRGNAHFVNGEDRIYLNKYGKLSSIQWDGGDEKEIVKITGITTFGSVAQWKGRPVADVLDLDEEDEDAAKENNPASSANTILMSPLGKAAIAQVNNNIYYITIPQAGKLVEISVADAKSAAFPSKLLTEMGGEFQAGKLMEKLYTIV